MNINEIAKIAYNSTNPKKADLFGIVLKAADNDGQLSADDLAALYKYLSPAKTSKPKTPEQWVAMATANKHDRRDYLQYIYSDGSRICATDGHRMHIWETDKYPAGYYDKTMVKIDYDHTYPNIDRVIPQKAETAINIPDLEIGESVMHGKPIPVYCHTDFNIAAKYVDQALSVFKDKTLSWEKSDNPGLLIHADGGKTAVVMPMRKA